jgi:trigger factor
MLDELRLRLAEQGIGFEEYLKAREIDEAALRRESRADAEKRVKTLLVLSEIAEREQIEVSDQDLEAELARSRERYAGNQRLLEYLESPRGRAYTRSILRRAQTVETLIDRWIADHPEFANVQHIHEEPSATPAAPPPARRATPAGRTDTIRRKKGKR